MRFNGCEARWVRGSNQGGWLDRCLSGLDQQRIRLEPQHAGRTRRLRGPGGACQRAPHRTGAAPPSTRRARARAAGCQRRESCPYRGHPWCVGGAISADPPTSTVLPRSHRLAPRCARASSTEARMRHSTFAETWSPSTSQVYGYSSSDLRKHQLLEHHNHTSNPSEALRAREAR